MRNTMTGLVFESLTNVNLNMINISKAKFKKYLLCNNLIDKTITFPSGCIQPDEAWVDTNERKIYIIEKKYQMVSGSCDEKIQTAVFKSYFYNKYINYNVKYIYCLSNWFKDDKYKIIIDYLVEHNIDILYGEDDDYNEKLLNLINVKINICKPVIKWVGGKTQILNNIIKKLPTNINNYYEFFVGGGSVFINILYLNYISKINVKHFHIYDINPILICMYNTIKYNPYELIYGLKTIMNSYVDNKELYYYSIRDKYNQLDVVNMDKVCMFIFLNKTCFRGLYRESKKGFNVPFGNYENPNIDYDNIINLHRLFKNVSFYCSDYKNIEIFKNSTFNNDDCIYLDPPYYPLNKLSFTKYNVDDFTLNDHNTLFDYVNNINCFFILSNHNVPYVVDKFKHMNIEIINCKRKINSKHPENTVEEVLIYK